MTCAMTGFLNFLAKLGAGSVLPALILGCALAAPSSAAASACAGAGTCVDAAQLFATPASDGTAAAGCSAAQLPQISPSGSIDGCVNTNAFGNNCFGNGGFSASWFGCPGTPIYFPATMTPVAPPTWTYVPPSIQRTSANTVPCDVFDAQFSNTAVNSNGCGGTVATADAPSPNPIGVSSATMTASAYAAPPPAGDPSAGQTASGQSSLGQLISSSLSQFLGANPGILSSTSSAPSSSTSAAPASSGSAAPASSPASP